MTTRDLRPLIGWTIAMTALAVITLWAMYLARGVLLLIYISALFAIGLGPIVRSVERQRIIGVSGRVPRWVAILTIYVVFLGVLAVVGSLIIPPIIDQGRQLAQGLPGMIDRAQDFFIQRGLLDHKLTWQEAVQKAPKGALGGDTVTTVVGAVAGFAGGLFGLITILILTFYMLVESDQIFESIARVFPRKQRGRVSQVSREISTKVSAWLGGQLLLGLVIGSTATIGLWLIGVPFFFVLGLLAGVGELIPMVGPILSAIPAIAVALSVSPAKALVVAGFFLAQQQFENHLLVPKIMSKQVGVSAVTVISSLLIGGSLLGIVGALLAVPTAAMLQVLFEQLTSEEPSDAA